MGDFALKQDNLTHIEMVGQSVKHTHLARHYVSVGSETGIGLILSHMNQGDQLTDPLRASHCQSYSH